MRPASVSELLTAWERGREQEPVARALTMLALAAPDAPADALEQLSVGRRDGLLLALRERAFGPRLVGLTDCPACGDHLEFSCEVKDIRTDTPRADEEFPGEEIRLIARAAGYEVHLRLPDSRDLAAIADCEGLEAGQRALLERCIQRVQQGEEDRAIDDLPADALDAVVECMVQADPQADVRLALTCPSCTHRWEAVFDIASYMWQELDAWAACALRTVHALASAYGWTERDILAMSPARRQAYLDMLGGGTAAMTR